MGNMGMNNGPKFLFFTTSLLICFIIIILYTYQDFNLNWILIPTLIFNAIFMIFHIIAGWELSKTGMSESLRIMFTGALFAVIAFASNKVFIIYPIMIIGIVDVLIGINGIKMSKSLN